MYCAKEPVTLHYNATELTWIHCVNCCELIRDREIERQGYRETKRQTKIDWNLNFLDTVKQHSNAMSPEVVAKMDQMATTEATTTTTEEPTSTLTVPGMKPEDEGSLILHGCVVNFQMVPFDNRPEHFKAPLEKKFHTPSAEICAHGCYQVCLLLMSLSPGSSISLSHFVLVDPQSTD